MGSPVCSFSLPGTKCIRLLLLLSCSSQYASLLRSQNPTDTAEDTVTEVDIEVIEVIEATATEEATMVKDLPSQAPPPNLVLNPNLMPMPSPTTDTDMVTEDTMEDTVDTEDTDTTAKDLLRLRLS